MRVTNTNNAPIQNGDVASANGARHARAGRRSESSAAPSASDSVKSDISARGREFARAKEVAAETPDVREDKIAELRSRIAEGKYKIDADGIADRMVNEHMHMGIG